MCHILYTLEDGTAGSASVSNTDVCGSGHRLELFGDKKTLVLKNESWDYFHGFQAWQGALQDKELQLCDIPVAFQLQRTAEDSRVDPFARVAKRFIEAIAQGRTDVGPSFVDGVRAQRLVDAVRSSTESGEWVALSA